MFESLTDFFNKTTNLEQEMAKDALSKSKDTIRILNSTAVDLTMGEETRVDFEEVMKGRIENLVNRASSFVEDIVKSKDISEERIRVWTEHLCKTYGISGENYNERVDNLDNFFIDNPDEVSMLNIKLNQFIKNLEK